MLIALRRDWNGWKCFNFVVLVRKVLNAKRFLMPALVLAVFQSHVFFSMFSQYKSLKPFQHYQSEMNNGFNKEIQHAYNLVVSTYYYNETYPVITSQCFSLRF